MIKLSNFQLIRLNDKSFEILTFLLFLITVLIIGDYGLYDYAYILQIVFLLIFFEFKIKPKTLIINIISLIILIFFFKSFDKSLILISFFIFILSFDISSKFYIYMSKTKLFFLTLAFSFLMIFLMNPYVKSGDINHGYLFELNIKEKININSSSERKFYDEYKDLKPYMLYSNQRVSNQIYLTFCKKENSCKELNIIKNNRFHYNGLDINFSSLVFAIIFLSIGVLAKNRNHKFLIVTFGLILIYAFTKSRFLVPCICSYYFYLIFKDKLNLKILILILISIIVIYLFSVYFFFTDYFTTIINKKYPIDEFGIINNFEESSIMYRFLNIFHPSTLYKFRDISSALNEIILNFELYIFPNSDFKLNNPHNIFLNLIINFGYIISFIIFFNIFQSFKNRKFIEILYPLLIGSMFLGAQMFILINLILIISNLKVKNYE